MRQVVLDTETTGLEPDMGHRIIEIGAVEMVNRKQTGRHFHAYVNPQRDIDDGALEVHGISRAFLSDKPLFDDIAEQFLSFVRDADLVIHNAPFEECAEWVGERTFVYFDPPYRPLSKTSHFVSYSKGDFNDKDQERLAALFHTLDGMGAQLLLSNSDPKNTVPNDDFFDDLYSKFTIDRVEANRSINSNPDKRGAITELLIRNYT